MARRVFFSFHFDNDYWRTQQVRKINALEGQAVATANDWEEVKRKGDASIQRWIGDQMDGKTCVVVLVGSETATRPWVQYEIVQGWNAGKGVLGIRIDKLLNSQSQPSRAGSNPFDFVTFTKTARTLAEVAPLVTPIGANSREAYASIANNIESWIEDAIRIRASH